MDARGTNECAHEQTQHSTARGYSRAGRARMQTQCRAEDERVTDGGRALQVPRRQQRGVRLRLRG